MMKTYRKSWRKKSKEGDVKANARRKKAEKKKSRKL